MTKWVYLLNWVGQPTSHNETSCKDNEIWNPPSLSNIGITLIPVSLIWKLDFEVYQSSLDAKNRTRKTKMNGSIKKLFGIRIEEGKRDDQFAQQFADATMAAMIMGNPMPDPGFPAVFPLPLRRLSKQGEVSLRQLIKEDSQRGYKERFGEEGLVNFFGTVSYIAARRVAWIWKMVPALIKDPHLFDAAHYFWASVHEFFFAGDDITEVLNNINETPISKISLVRAENAIQNAFKTIEAIIGDPPKDEKKLRNKIQAAGLDPDKKVGWDLPEEGIIPQSVLIQVKKLSLARDKRAAHAHTGADRRITYFEMMDAQALALMFLIEFAQRHLRNSEI